MGQGSYLSDSNAIIYYLGNGLPESGKLFMDAIIDEVPKISIITKIEILGFNASEIHTAQLAEFISDSEVLHLSDEIALVAIDLRKNGKIKLPDAIIAATAISHDLTLVTRNVSDFKGIYQLRVVLLLRFREIGLSDKCN